MMRVLSSPKETQDQARLWRQQGPIALVPTMGALHAGHMKLVDTAREQGRRVIVSLFVNPLQFGPSEDFDRYPRPFEADRALCEQARVDLLFAPTPADLYPPGYSTRVNVTSLSAHLCGATRPGHFEGVATICLKLFQISQADIAVFGEKDFQQLRVLQQMVEDLNLPLRLVPQPTVRENDGLALSSRNRYLSPEERGWAARIPQALRALKEQAAAHPEARVGELLDGVAGELSRAPLQIDYLALCSEKDLVPVARDSRISTISRARFFLAVRAGKTRLIDNIALNEERE